jgi:hypothetical protein
MLPLKPIGLTLHRAYSSALSVLLAGALFGNPSGRGDDGGLLAFLQDIVLPRFAFCPTLACRVVLTPLS